MDIKANWQTFLVYAVILIATGAGAYLKLIDGSIFQNAIVAVIAHGIGTGTLSTVTNTTPASVTQPVTSAQVSQLDATNAVNTPEKG